MSTNDDGRKPGQSGTMAGAPGLRGVTFLNQPGTSGAPVQYHIRLASGKRLGPFDTDYIRTMVRSGSFRGTEEVSRDGEQWQSIQMLPELAEAFAPVVTSDSTMYGTHPATETEEAYSLADALAAASGSLPAAPGRLSESGLGVSGLINPRAASGAWSSTPQGGADLSVSRIVQPDPTALSNVAGVRRLGESGSPPLPTGFGSTTTEDSTEAHLPPGILPRGRTLIGESGVSPAVPQSIGSGLDPSLPTPVENRADLPVSRSFSAELPRSTGFTDLPRSTGMSDLPRSAGGTDLPGVANNLPRPAGFTDLPAPGGTLPVPSANVGLPGRQHEFPAAQTGIEAPTPAGEGRPTLNFGEGGPRVGGATLLMEGLDAELPGLPTNANAELPTSTATRGRSLLEELGEVEDLWADAGGVLPGANAPTTEPARSSAGDALGLGDDFFPSAPSVPSTRAVGSFGAGTSPSPASTPTKSGIDEFFGTQANAAIAQQTAPVAGAAAATDAAGPVVAQAPAAPARRRSLPIVPIAGGLVAAAALGAGIFFFATREKGPTEEELAAAAEGSVAPVVPAGPTEMAALTDLRPGTFLGLEAYAETGRAVVASQGRVDDRGQLMVALALMLAERPDDDALADELSTLNGQLGEGELSAVAELGRGAFLAATGDPAALDSLRLLRRGENGALAELLTGIYWIQEYREVDYSKVLAAEAAEVEGSGEGSGDGSGEGSGADATAAEEGSGEIATPVDVLALPIPAPAEARHLSEEATRALDAAIEADGALVGAIYWRGWAALESGDADEAERLFQRAVEANPEHVPSWIGGARALLQKGNLVEADTRIQRVIDELQAVSAPHERADAYVAAAEISVARLRPELAIESLLSALQVDSSHAEALELLSEQFDAAGQYRRALDYFETNGAALPASPAVDLGVIRAMLGLENVDGARARIQQASERYPRDPRFPYYLARVHESLAEFTEAEGAYRLAVQTDPSFIEAHVRLAELAQRANRKPDAMRILDQASQYDIRDAAVLNEIGETYLTLNETNRAVASFRRALEVDRSAPDARINLAEFYLSVGQDDDAFSEVQAMIAAGVDSPRIRYLNVQSLLGQGENSRAIEEMLQLLESDPDNAQYMLLLGEAQFAAGNWTAALERFQAAYEEQSTLVEALYYVGRANIELGNSAEAIAALTTVAQRSDRGEYHYWLGVALEQGLQPTQAYGEYVNAVDGDIAWCLENPEIFHRRGRLLLSRGGLTLAYRDFRVFNTLRPTDAKGWWAIGQVFYEQRRWPEAIDMMLRSLALNPEQPLVHYYTGLAALNLEPRDNTSAAQHLEIARDGGIGNQRTELYQKLGYVYRDLGRPQDAVASLREYLSRATLTYDERRETENEIRNLGGTP